MPTANFSPVSASKKMECFLVFGVVIFAGSNRLIVTVLAKFNVIDSDIELDEREF